MTKAILKDTLERMKKAEQSYVRELGGIRAGRANPSLLNRVNIDYYGAPTPLNQVAQISVPEPRVLLITPYDKSALGDIEKALNQSDIGIPPSNDGNVIRLVVPALTEDRRKDIAKQVGKESENAKVSVRNIRRDANSEFKEALKEKMITEDELRSGEEKIQKITDQHVKDIDKHLEVKEADLMSM